MNLILEDVDLLILILNTIFVSICVCIIVYFLSDNLVTNFGPPPFAFSLQSKGNSYPVIGL